MNSKGLRAWSAHRCAGWMVAAAIGLGAGDAQADRHCYPAEDDYYAMRFALLADEGDCPSRLATAADRLAAALSNARICGCADLISLYEGLAAVAGDETRSCEDRSAALLDAADTVKATVSACH